MTITNIQISIKQVMKILISKDIVLSWKYDHLQQKISFHKETLD